MESKETRDYCTSRSPRYHDKKTNANGSQERYINGFRDTPLAEKHVKIMKSHNRNMSICLSIIPLAYKNEHNSSTKKKWLLENPADTDD